MASCGNAMFSFLRNCCFPKWLHRETNTTLLISCTAIKFKKPKIQDSKNKVVLPFYDATGSVRAPASAHPHQQLYLPFFSIFTVQV